MKVYTLEWSTDGLWNDGRGNRHLINTHVDIEILKRDIELHAKQEIDLLWVSNIQPLNGIELGGRKGWYVLVKSGIQYPLTTHWIITEWEVN